MKYYYKRFVKAKGQFSHVLKFTQIWILRNYAGFEYLNVCTEANMNAFFCIYVTNMW